MNAFPRSPPPPPALCSPQIWDSLRRSYISKSPFILPFPRPG